MKEHKRRISRLWSTAVRRRALSLLCAGALISGMLPLSLMASAQGEPPMLSNLILDKVYELDAVDGYPQGVAPNDIGFAPQVTEYTGTAYLSVDSIQVYPFAQSDTAEVTVNGEELNAQGYVEMDVSEVGIHELEVEVTDGGETNVYTVEINKVNTDYRGRVPAVYDQDILQVLSVDTDFDNSDALLDILKKDYAVVLPESTLADGSYVNTEESYWSVPGSELPDSTGTDEAVTLFTVDLGAVYSVSRIRAAFGPSNLALGTNKARISVSTDGETWETPITNGNMNTGVQYHQNVTRYEFGVSYQARYIRFEVTHWQRPESELRLYQFMIFTDSGTVPEEQPAPEGGSVPYQHEERHQYLASGQATVVERGLPMLGWTPSSGYGRGIPTVEEAEQFGYDGPLFYDPDFENADYMLYNPDSLWGIAKAPFGGNNMSSAGEPQEFIPDSMEAYVYNAISFCFGDEGGYSTSEAEALADWFEWTRQHYPGVILHTNQYPNQWSLANLQEYIRIAQPDLLTWDDYYGDSSWANPSSINLSNTTVQEDAARKLLNLSTWENYRMLAYGGVDGTGTQPIMFGQYLDAFAFNHSQSNKNLIVNLSLLSGMKWLNFFRVEYQFDRSYLWDEDGTPTRGLLEWGEIIDRVHAIDDQLTRLNNDWIMFKVGEMGDESAASATGFRRGNFDADESAAKNQEFGLSEISVVSLSDTHDGQTGDVVLGYFNTLPGLYESEIAEYFAGATAPKAFMVMNGLVAGTAERYNQFNIPEREAGSSDNTCQQITITADPSFVAAGYALYEVDKDNNGELKQVTLDDTGSFTITLGGGEANLYFWATDTTAKASSQSEGAYASFAFDGHPETYWQPQQESQSYTLENTFDVSLLGQITVVEKGDAIQSMTASYQDADGSWHDLGALTETEGVWTGTGSASEAATALRLTVQAQDLPAIYDVEMALTAADDQQTTTITVNDNTMGSGLFRFSYDDLWSYRETESNASAMVQYELENDGHFSNWEDAEATFTFYGTKVELLLRADQAQYIQAAITDDGMDGAQWKTGTSGTQSLIFDGLEQGVHTLTIRKTAANQAGIDGAKVTYSGLLPAQIVEENSTQADAVQVYVDQRTTDATQENYFTYQPSNVTSKNMGNNNDGFNVDSDEADGWVQHVQNAQYQNLGFTRTNMDNASYTLHFNGTGVQLYAGVTPMGDTDASNIYGTLTFTLDGEVVEPSVLDTTNLGTNGKISARMWSIDVPGATENADHELTVSVQGGYLRVDYAVVERMWESELVGNTFSISVAAGEHGSAQLLTDPQVSAGGSAVIAITPDEGYQIQSILVNNVAQIIPDDGRLVITNIQADTSIQVSFTPAVYDITLAPGDGGVLVPSTLQATAGTTISITVQAFSGYQFKAGSLTVTEADGTQVEVSTAEDSSFQFTMPAQSVSVSAIFQPIQYQITVDQSISGGSLSASNSSASQGETVTVTTQPQDGYLFQAGSLCVIGTSGVQVPVTQTNETTYTFFMPAEAVFITGIFEQIAEPTQVNKTLLEKTIAYAEGLDTTGVTDSAKKLFDAALAQAKSVMEDDTATQDEVTAAWDNLLEGIWALGITQGDKTLLNLVIDRAEGMDETKYVPDYWQQLVEALDAAQKVAESGDSTQDVVDEATEALLGAILAQRFKADKSILEELISQAENIDLSGYTEESVAVFRTALANARAVLADKTLSEDDQATVDAAADALSTAMDSLTAGETSETMGTPEATENPSDVPQTGDTAQLNLVFAVLMVSAVGLVTMVTIRKRRN